MGFRELRVRGRSWCGLAAALLLLACDGGGDDGDPGSDQGPQGGGGGADATIGGAGGAMPGGAGGQGGVGGAGATGPPPICNAGTLYAAGTPLFVERTDEWRLREIGAEGVLLTVGDIDGDGWADIVVRRGGTRASVLEPGEIKRHVWVLRNTGEGTFEDRTEASGIEAVRGDYPIAVGRPIAVVAFADVDNDGDQDLYTGSDTRQPVTVERDAGDVVVEETSELLLNDGAGRFELTYELDPLRRAGFGDFPASAVFTDWNLDGQVDLWMPQGGVGAPMQDRLFTNQGEGTFVDGTAAAGLSARDWVDLDDLNEGRAYTTAWSGAACDLNDDGRPELLAASYGRAPNHLWLAEAGGFVNRSVASGYAFDEDGRWEDNEFARCYCAAHRDAEGCAEVAPPRVQCQDNWRHELDRQPFRTGGNSGATVCAELTGDGALDLLTTEIKHWWAGEGADGSEVLVNTGEAEVRFERPGREALGMTVEHASSGWDEGHITAGVLDVDNDGRPDLYIGGTDYPGNRGLLFHNESEPGAPRFVPVPVADAFEHNRSHGMAVADFDHDGDLDLVVGHSRFRCNAQAPNDCYETAQVRFFENVLGQDGNWLQLDLEGSGGSNRGAVGARVTVRAGDRLQVQEISGGYGHYGAQPDRVLHFGLGAACEAEVTVRWPDAELTTQTFQLGAGYRYRLRQGDAPRALE